ncbi:MAG TPA: AMP-binding protein, partial [Bryobacteraceae bacterium]
MNNEVAEAGILPEWHAWNATERVHADMSCIHLLFDRAASRNPRKIAVRCGGRQLSFGELAERANRLAASLQTAGVNHGSIVGVGLPRSADAVVAMLAVLKCGGAYLPLDPALPGDRIEFMLAEAGVSVVVTSISESQAASN